VTKRVAPKSIEAVCLAANSCQATLCLDDAVLDGSLQPGGLKWIGGLPDWAGPWLCHQVGHQTGYECITAPGRIDWLGDFGNGNVTLLTVRIKDRDGLCAIGS